MNHLSSIKERLINFNDSEFQELCDCFLSLRHRGYKAYARSGAHDSKQKTTRGTPDSFFLMPNGRYLFVESTTMEHKGNRLLKKLKDDISSCLNEDKTGVPRIKIQEIILCYNSNLTARELEDVNSDVNNIMGKNPMHYSLNSLASEIFLHHKNLAHDYLGLPLDSGQVVSVEKFVEEYDNGKQKLATPLAGAFLHRSKELESVCGKLGTGDIIIISGPAGVGKSKLALEAINRFLQSHLNYNAYAISPKGADLLGDMGAYFGGDEKSILLVDDINRVDKFEQILGFYRSLKSGKLKLVLTVRDYALENVREWLSNYLNSIVEINGFSYEEISAIIEQKPFEVRNSKCQNKINTIAKGNARLAVMMAMIIRKTNTLDSLNNVSDLFEQYFETFVSDVGAFKDKRVLKALGILSFFNTLPYNDGELLDSVASSFLISRDELREAFDLLHNLDLIELNYQHVRIGEQNLSTYFFYKIFIKERLLSFESLLSNYFELQEHRFKDTVYPMYQNFGREFITKEIRPALLSYWSAISVDESRALRFLNFAWELLPNECFEYLEVKINSCDRMTVRELKTKYEVNDFASTSKQNVHLKLLANFFKEQTTLLDAIYLSFQLTDRVPQHLPQLIYHIDQSIIFIDEDYITQFTRHAVLVDYLISEVGKGRLQALAFFAVSRTLLKWLHWTYKNAKEAEKDDLNIASVKLTRGKILDTLCKVYIIYPEDVFKVMLDFSFSYVKDDKYTHAFDLSYLIPWVDHNLNSAYFRHCYYVQELMRVSIKEKFVHDKFKRWKLSFKHPTYSIFELANWDMYRGKNDYDFKDYGKFNRLKIADIAKKLTFRSIDEVKQFVIRYREILQWDQIQLYSQRLFIDAVISANLKSDHDIGFATLIEIARLEDEREQVLISYILMDNFAQHSELAERFWEAIDSEKLNKTWKLEVLMSLPEKEIKEEHLSRLYEVLNGMKRNFHIRLQQLRKFEKVDLNILQEVLRIVVKKIEEENLNVSVGHEFFVQLDYIDDINLLKKAYLQQAELDDHFDYRGQGLLVILRKDDRFLLEFIKTIFEKDSQKKARDHKVLAIVWELPNVENILDEAIEYLANIVNYYILMEHFANAFFQGLNSNVEKADKYLLKLIERYFDQPNIIHIAFDIILNSRKELFAQAFINYIRKNQDVNCFKKISWSDKQILYPGDAIVGAIRAANWEKLLRLIENANLGIKTRAVRNYVKCRRDSELRYAENERRRKFFTGF